MKKIIILVVIALVICCSLAIFLFVDKSVKVSKIYVIEGYSDSDYCSLNLKTFNNQKFILTRQSSDSAILPVIQNMQMTYKQDYNELKVTENSLFFTLYNPAFNGEYLLELDKIYEKQLYSFVLTKKEKYSDEDIIQFKNNFDTIELKEMKKLMDKNCPKYKLVFNKI